MMVSVDLILMYLWAPETIRLRTAFNSPCEPVQTIVTISSGSLMISSIFMIVSLGALI